MSEYSKGKRSFTQKVEMTPTPLTVPDPSKEHQDMLVLPGSRKTTVIKNAQDVLVSASPASQQQARALSPEVSEELERLSKIRARTLKFKQDSQRVFTFINKGEHLELITFLENEPDIKVHALYDDRGYTTLHLAAFRNNDKIVAFLLKLVSSKLESMSEMKAWVNKKTAKEGFTALHFGSFRGNINMIRSLIKYQADIRALNFYGLNVMHVAAQGDQPVSLVYFKEKNVPYQVRDKRYSTPLHWACYSGSEIAAAYLLSWDQDVNIKDSEGLTPLHLAVRSSFETNNTRIVKCLLLKGADRSVKDAKGRRPVDFLSEGREPSITAELRSLLKKPKFCTCYMIRTPLVKMRKSPTTLILFYIQFLLSHIFILLYGMPFIHSPIWFGIHQLLGVLLFIALLLLWSRDPGYLKKPRTSFLHLVQKFDPCSLCPDCQVIRTDRSRHCTFCNRCVERFDHHCPWINNCVGAKNHGIFMFFIVLTPVYLLFTIVMVAFSFNNKAACDSRTLPPCITDQQDYDQTAWRVMLILICLLAGFFIPPTLILFSVQAKNFCMGQTTSERFARHRSSSADSSVTSSDSFVDHERRSSSVGARRRQGPPVASMQNCLNMCCKGEIQDQNQIAEIKSITESRISSAIVQMEVERVKRKEDKPEEEHLMGEVFNRSDSFKAIQLMKQQ